MAEDLKWSIAECRAGHKTAAGRSGFGRKATDYLDAVKEGKSSAEALEAAKMSPSTLGSLRGDLAFVAAEQTARIGVKITAEEVIPLQQRMQKEWYIQALKDNAGNRTKAREASSLSRDAYNTLAEDALFREQEIDVLEGIVDEIEEQSVRVATGNGARVRDTQHLRWMLEKLKKERYGPAPKVIDMRYSGNVTVQSVDDEIQQLLRGADISDAVLVEK